MSALYSAGLNYLNPNLTLALTTSFENCHRFRIAFTCYPLNDRLTNLKYNTIHGKLKKIELQINIYQSQTDTNSDRDIKQKHTKVSGTLKTLQR